MVGYLVTLVMVFLTVVANTNIFLNSIRLVKVPSFVVLSLTFKYKVPFNVFVSLIWV